MLQLLQIGAMGFGGGVAGRSLLGLARMFDQPHVDTEEPGTSLRPELHINPAHALAKSAAPQQPPGVIDQLIQTVSDKLPGISTEQPLKDWWGPSASIGAAGLGIGGGYALANWLLNRERKARQSKELRETETDYQKALSEEYNMAMMAKHAGDDLGIDALYDLMQAQEKTAEFPRAATAPWEATLGHDTVQQIKGWLTAAMLATGAGTGYAMYKHTKNKNRGQALQQALAARARRRSMISPVPPYILADDSETQDLKHG